MIRFADTETLLDNLGVAPGNVSPLALANDTALQVRTLATMPNPAPTPASAGLGRSAVIPRYFHFALLCFSSAPGWQVNVAVDKKLLTTSDLLWFHPLTNEASVGITAAQLLAIIAGTGHATQVIDFTA